MIDTLQASYNIDSTRIYVNGISNGGGMAFVLSCALSDRVAAVGVVAPAQSLSSSWRAKRPPVPVIAFHGTDDPLVPCDGGPLGDPFNPVKPIFPDARKFVADWASRNRCAPKPTESSVALDIRRIEYARCANDAGVTFCTVHGGGHTWPGGERSLPEWHVGRTCNSIDATGLMWEFFGKHWLAKRP